MEGRGVPLGALGLVSPPEVEQTTSEAGVSLLLRVQAKGGDGW